MDAEFKEQNNSDVVGVRLVDDVYLGANSYDEAEKLLRDYQLALRKYELDINESKTKIFDVRDDLEPYWPVEIRRELERFGESSESTQSQISDLAIYLDEIIRRANQTGDDGIIKFAIRVIDRQHLWKKYWEVIEPFLIRAAIVFPHSIDYVARVVVWRCRQQLHVMDKDKWKEVCEKIISHHARLGNDSEVVWTCWLLKEIRANINGSICEDIINHCGPFSVLLVLDLHSEGLLTNKFPETLLRERLGETSMQESDWLLLYEAERSFGYHIKQQDKKHQEVYKKLISEGVQFYKPDASPVVFEGVDESEWNTVPEAIEPPRGSQSHYVVVKWPQSSEVIEQQ